MLSVTGYHHSIRAAANDFFVLLSSLFTAAFSKYIPNATQTNQLRYQLLVQFTTSPLAHRRTR